MKTVLIVVSILMILTGSVWLLQGMNVLGGSMMSGHPQWITNGAIVAVIGLGLLILGVTRRKAHPKI
jgi:hypothetical protein